MVCGTGASERLVAGGLGLPDLDRGAQATRGSAEQLPGCAPGTGVGPRDIAELRSELKTDIAELKSDMAELRSEVRSETASLRADMAELKQDLTRTFATLLFVSQGVLVSIVGLLVALT